MTRQAAAARIAVLLALVFAAPASAGEVERLHFLAAPGGTPYYSSDADDPEAPAGSRYGSCGSEFGGTARFCQLTFLPAVVLDAPLSWSSEAPLRFHLELDVLTLDESDLEVKLFVQSRDAQYDSAPAVRVAPGVWEGELKGAPRTVDPAAMTLLGIRVRGGQDLTRLTARLRGRSWVDLPAPVSGSSVPELVAATPAPAAPGVYQTPERRLTFADAAWSAQAFDGTTATDRIHDITLPEAASAVYAWAEHDNRPFVHAAASGEDPEPGAATDSPLIHILRGGKVIGTGNASSRAAANVPAGSLQIRVARTSTTTRPKPYRLHVVVVYGARTLTTLRWRTVVLESFFVPGIAQCPHTFDPLVVPSSVKTFSVGFTWTSPNPSTRWALAYDLPTVGSFVCGYPDVDARVRFVLPPANRVLLFEPRIDTTSGPAVSVSDTVFEFEARLTY